MADRDWERLLDRAMAAAGWARSAAKPRRYARSEDGVETRLEAARHETGVALAVQSSLPGAGSTAALWPWRLDAVLPPLPAGSGPGAAAAALLGPEGQAIVARQRALLAPAALVRAAATAPPPPGWSAETVATTQTGDRTLVTLDRLAPTEAVLGPAFGPLGGTHVEVDLLADRGWHGERVARAVLGCRPGVLRLGGGRTGAAGLSANAVVLREPLPPAFFPVARGEAPATGPASTPPSLIATATATATDTAVKTGSVVATAAVAADLHAWIAAEVDPLADALLADARAIAVPLLAAIARLIAAGYTAPGPHAQHWWRHPQGAGSLRLLHWGDRLRVERRDDYGYHPTGETWGPWHDPDGFAPDAAALLSWIDARLS